MSGCSADAFRALEAEQRSARLDGSIAATWVRPDLSAVLGPQDLMTVLAALRDAAEYRGHSLGSQDRDRAQEVVYRSLSYKLGDDRG